MQVRERSLIHKWLSGSSTPPASYFPDIARIVSERTSQGKKLILEQHLRSPLCTTTLSGDIRSTVLAAGAAVTGSLLWNGLNRLLGLPYFMGRDNVTLRGAHALLWGIVTTVPIPLPLFLLVEARQRRTLVVRSIVLVAVTCLAAWVFYTSGIRESVVPMNMSYSLQELLIVVICAASLSMPSLLATAMLVSRGGLMPRHGLLLILPTVAAPSAVAFTLIIDRPAVELVPVRGLAVGLALRLAMFFSLVLNVRSSVAVRARRG
jgi:hypothetical protein